MGVGEKGTFCACPAACGLRVDPVKGASVEGGHMPGAGKRRETTASGPAHAGGAWNPGAVLLPHTSTCSGLGGGGERPPLPARPQDCDVSVRTRLYGVTCHRFRGAAGRTEPRPAPCHAASMQPRLGGGLRRRPSPASSPKPRDSHPMALSPCAGTWLGSQCSWRPRQDLLLSARRLRMPRMLSLSTPLRKARPTLSIVLFVVA